MLLSCLAISEVYISSFSPVKPDFISGVSRLSKEIAALPRSGTVVSTSLQHHEDSRDTVKDERDTDERISYDRVKEKRWVLTHLFAVFFLTQRGTACKCPMASNVAKINSQIESLSRMTQASGDFEKELEKLAVLVH